MKQYIEDDFDKNLNGEKYLVGYVSGHTKKDFVRINDCADAFKKDIEDKFIWKKTIKDSKYLGELFESMRQDNCSYVTYFDDLIKGKSEDDVYYPNYVSCLAKVYAAYDPICACEVIGSRLANAMGIRTVYNFVSPKKNTFLIAGVFDYPIDSYMFSVDYMKPDYQIVSFESLGIEFNSRDIIADNLDKLHISLRNFARNNGRLISIDDIENIKRNFCIEYLFKRILCGDADFYGRNVDIMFNTKTGKFELAPSHDYEYIFDEEEEYPTIGSIRDSFIQIDREFPGLVDEFYKKVMTLNENGVFSKVFDQKYFYEPEYRLDYYSRFQNNISYFKMAYELAYLDKGI